MSLSSKVTVLSEFKQRKGSSFGSYISQIREKRGLTQQQVVERLPGKIDRSVISKWETGVLSPSPEDVVEVSRAMNSPELLKMFCEGCPVCMALNKSLPRPAA